MKLQTELQPEMRSKLLALGGLALLFVLLFGGRWAWFYRGSYVPPVIPEIDGSPIALNEASRKAFEDRPVAGDGRVLIDLAHANNLETNDLAPLRGRLEARGVSVEVFRGVDAALSAQLRGATALLVVAPTVRYTAEEQDAVADFVADGGGLLLAADPTRSVLTGEDEWLPLSLSLASTGAVPAINSLANAFGVIYYDDYVYNLEHNAGNYRDVAFTVFDEDHALTRDLETLVFFAAHSLRSDGLALVTGDVHTRSPVRSGETGLAAATLSVDGRVLALGDVTFMTAPYHTIEDNDRFLSHIADWLAVDGRARDDLEDFPYLFRQPVDLVQVSGDSVDPRLIAQGSQLGDLFEQAGLSLALRAEPAPGHDVLYVGTFDDLGPAQDFVSGAGITVTTFVTTQTGVLSPDRATAEANNETEIALVSVVPPSATLSTIGDTVAVAIEIGDVRGLYGAEVHLAFDPGVLEVVDADPDAEGVQIADGTFLSPDFVAINRVDNAAGTIGYAVAQMPPRNPADGSGSLATVTFRGKELGTSAVSFESALLSDRDGNMIPSTTEDGFIVVGEGEPPSEGETETAEIEGGEQEPRDGLHGSIEVEALGKIGIQGTSLFVVDRRADRAVVLVLAEDGAAAVSALERLAANDLSACVEAGAATVCSTGVAQESLGLDGGVAPSGEDAGKVPVFILSDDDADCSNPGTSGARTSAAEFEAILSESYDVRVWSMRRDGVPTKDDLDGYAAYIATSGDYAYDEAGPDILSVLEDVERGGVMLAGAQILPGVDERYEPIEDLKVVDAAHALAAGFAADETFTLLASESGVPAVIMSEADLDGVDFEACAVFARGPDSPEAGAPVLVALADDEAEDEVGRVIVATFAFYRLPEDARRRLALNAVGWLAEGW